MESSSSKASIQVLDRASAILRVLTQHHDPVNLKVIAEETNLHVSTCHRLLADLVRLRFVEKGSTAGTYRLGLRLLQLGNLVRDRISIRDTARSDMVSLHEQTGQNINLVIRQNDSVVYIDRVLKDKGSVPVARTLGTTAPLHLTSAGKLFLTEDSSEQIRNYAIRAGLEQATDHSISNVENLLLEIEKVKTLGFAMDDEEFEEGMSCIAAGIRNDRGELVACLSLTAPKSELKNIWISELKKAADNVSEHMGYAPMQGELYVRPDFL